MEVRLACWTVAEAFARRNSFLSSPFQRVSRVYEHLLEAILEKLATRTEGKPAVLIAAQLSYEDWTITSLERLEESERNIARPM